MCSKACAHIHGNQVGGELAAEVILVVQILPLDVRVLRISNLGHSNPNRCSCVFTARGSHGRGSMAQEKTKACW